MIDGLAHDPHALLSFGHGLRIPRRRSGYIPAVRIETGLKPIDLRFRIDLATPLRPAQKAPRQVQGNPEEPCRKLGLAPKRVYAQKGLKERLLNET